MKKLSSYQKLKQKIDNQRKFIDKLINDPEFYFTEVLTKRIQEDINKRLLFGDGEGPTGTINLPK